MKKIGICLGLIVFITLVAGLYGALHDQLTYSISNEYFTKFKYEQFGFEPAWFGGHRPTVALIGFLSTWWVGLIIGLVFGLLGLLLVARASLVSTLLRAVRLAFGIIIATEVVGYCYGRFFLAKTGVTWELPVDLQHPADFITVGSIHNFGYFGGVLGLFVGIVYIVQHRGISKLGSSMRASF